MTALPKLNGLVLAGGHSRRMGRDKASLVYRSSGEPEWRRMAGLLAPFCSQVFLSVRRDQSLPDHREEDVPLLVDSVESAGPLTGLLTAFSAHPHSPWLVVACDLPLLDAETVRILLSRRGPQSITAFRSASDGLPEPLCAVYEPASRELLIDAFRHDRRCPRKILINAGEAVELLDLPHPAALDNANSREDFDRLRQQIAGAAVQ